MKTIIRINNQDAVPIRAIPYISGWKISPDKLLLTLAHQEMPIKINDLYAYNISENDEYVKILPKEWDNVYAVNKNLSSTLSRNQLNDDEGYVTWIVESIKLLPAACFVWKNDFEEKFNNAYATWFLHILNERDGDRELNFSPLVPMEFEKIVMEGFEISITPLRPVKDKAAHANVSENLSFLNQASTKFWGNADHNDVSTHPLNSTVATWLVGKGFTETLAEKGATIIRPKWAKTGRKADK